MQSLLHCTQLADCMQPEKCQVSQQSTRMAATSKRIPTHCWCSAWMQTLLSLPAAAGPTRRLCFCMFLSVGRLLPRRLVRVCPLGRRSMQLWRRSRRLGGRLHAVAGAGEVCYIRGIRMPTQGAKRPVSPGTPAASQVSVEIASKLCEMLTACSPRQLPRP